MTRGSFDNEFEDSLCYCGQMLMGFEKTNVFTELAGLEGHLCRVGHLMINLKNTCEEREVDNEV